MKLASLKKALITASILLTAGQTSMALAHSGGAIIDPGSSNARAVDLAAVTCGSGTHHLTARVRDNSGSASGLLLSLHLFKGTQMTTITDTASGDGSYSPYINLNGGAGVYYMSATKTKAGVRVFDVEWHCLSSDNQHTDTDLSVLQFQ